MALWQGRVDALFWSVHHATVTADEWDAYLDALRGLLDIMSASKRGACLTLAYRVEAPNAARRKSLAAIIEGPRARWLTRHALYTDSMATRGVLTALDWIVKKPYEERAFGDPLEAIRWICESAPGVSATDLARTITDAVPASALPVALRR